MKFRLPAIIAAALFLASIPAAQAIATGGPPDGYRRTVSLPNRQLQDLFERAHGRYLGVIAWAQGRFEEADAQVEAGLQLARPSSRPIVIGALNVQASMALLRGQLDRVIDAAEEAIKLSRETGELGVRGMLLDSLSQARWQKGESHRAEQLARDGIEIRDALHYGTCWRTEVKGSRPSNTLGMSIPFPASRSRGAVTSSPKFPATPDPSNLRLVHCIANTPAVIDPPDTLETRSVCGR